MEDLIKIGMLYQTYGPLLTDNQKALLSDYYYNDLSLQEIAENKDISKQAVSDQLRRAVKKMEGFESILASSRKTRAVIEILNPLIEDLDRDSPITTDEVNKKLKELRDILLRDGKEA